MNHNHKISIIVPCYNEAEALPLFHQETIKVLKGMESITYEIIFVDDGSTDETLQNIKALALTDSNIRYLSFSRNFGKEAGMYAGLRESEGDYCVIMDADLQHPPALLPQMYQAVSEENYDCCGGLRCGREGDGIFRSFFSKAFYKVSKKLTHMDMSDGHGDFRMMSRKMVDAILEIKEYNRYMKGIFSFVGFNTKWIKYHSVERSCGETKWRFSSLFSYALEGILSFTTTPLKWAGIVGIILEIIGVIFLGWKFLAYFISASAFDSFDIVMAAFLLLSGMQMIFLYIIGAYLSKDYLENKNRPLYIVREKS